MSGAPTSSARGDSPPSISSDQRDLLFEAIFRNLGGVFDRLQHAVWDEKHETADRRARDLRDDLTFVIEDLGWHDKAEDGTVVSVTTPRPILRGVLERLQSSAEELAPEIDLERSATENRKLIPTCRELLACLPLQGPGVTAQESERPPKEGPELARREVLVAALKAHPGELSREEIIRSVSENFFLSLDMVAAALADVLEIGLIVLGRSGVTAGRGLLIVNRSWGDLTEIY